MLHELKNLIESTENGSLQDALSSAFDVIFEGNFWNPKTAVTSASMMGDYSNIMKQVGVGVIGGGGAMIDKSIGSPTTVAKVQANPASMRDQAEETRNDWTTPKKSNPPLEPRTPQFIKKTIAQAQDHIPMHREMDIPSSQRRFAMIYPTLSTGINTALPKLN